MLLTKPEGTLEDSWELAPLYTHRFPSQMGPSPVSFFNVVHLMRQTSFPHYSKDSVSQEMKFIALLRIGSQG
jgi:hypothetical protein